MSRGRDLHVYPDRDELSAAVADHVAQLAAQAALERGRFTVAIPGGSAMAILASGLLGRPSAAEVNWSMWHVFWVDERCVPSTHPDSNCGAAERVFFSRVPIPRGQIHAVDGAAGPAAAARKYGSDLAEALRPENGAMPRFDLILLGLGEDGHIASLFPNHSALSESQEWVVPVVDSPKPPPERITLTLPVINNARRILLVAAGGGKADALARVWTPNSRGPALPAGLVHPVDGEMHWMVDHAAAAKLPAPFSTPRRSERKDP